MMTLAQMEQRIEVLRRRGYSAEDSERLAAAAGDAIETDEQGRWIVRDGDGKELARIAPLD